MNNTNNNENYNSDLNELSPQKIYYNTFPKKSLNIKDFVDDDKINDLEDNLSLKYNDEETEEDQSINFNKNITPTEFDLDKLFIKNPDEVKITPNENDLPIEINDDFIIDDDKDLQNNFTKINNKDNDISEYSLLDSKPPDENKINNLDDKDEINNLEDKDEINNLEDEFENINEKIDELDDSISDLEDSVDELDETIDKKILNPSKNVDKLETNNINLDESVDKINNNFAKSINLEMNDEDIFNYENNNNYKYTKVNLVEDEIKNEKSFVEKSNLSPFYESTFLFGIILLLANLI